MRRRPLASVASFGFGSLTLRISFDTGALFLSTICVDGGGCCCAASGQVATSASVRQKRALISVSSRSGPLRHADDDAAIRLHEILRGNALDVGRRYLLDACRAFAEILRIVEK